MLLPIEKYAFDVFVCHAEKTCTGTVSPLLESTKAKTIENWLQVDLTHLLAADGTIQLESTEAFFNIFGAGSRCYKKSKSWPRTSDCFYLIKKSWYLIFSSDHIIRFENVLTPIEIPYA